VTERLDCDVVVIGAGSGSAIARRLALRGRRVLIVGRDDAVPASVRNHRIKHSGAMQARIDTAADLWEAFRSMDAIERAHMDDPGAVVSLPEADADRVTDRWRAVGIPFDPAADADRTGWCDWGGGQRRFRTPDRPIDYPAVVRQALGSAVGAGAGIVRARSTKLEVDDGVLRRVVVRTAIGVRLVGARWCVVAAGAWTPELLAGIGVDLHLSRWRSHVLQIRDRVVPRLAIRLGPSLLVATPLGRTTVLGDARRVPADGGADPPVDPVDHPAIDAECAELLRRDAGAFLPGVQAATLRAATVTVGVKTEPPGHGSLGQGMALFGPERHGIEGLLVTLPGKASLMFALADRVAARIQNEDDAGRPLGSPPGGIPVGAAQAGGGGEGGAG
jgi:choline dehydrogenase-like flavoprotein